MLGSIYVATDFYQPTGPKIALHFLCLFVCGCVDLVMLTEPLTDLKWLPEELLSGLECPKAQLAFRHEISDLLSLGQAN